MILTFPSDADLKRVERRITAAYTQAGRELYGKWQDYLEKAEKAVKRYQDMYDAALSTGDVRKIAIAKKNLERAKLLNTVFNKRFKNMVEESTERIAHAGEIALQYANGMLPKIYAANYNAAMQGIAEDVPGYSFDLVNEDSVKYLMQYDRDLLPMQKTLNVPKDMEWSKRRINAEVTQGILQGESVPKLADRLMHAVGMSRASAIRNARTMFTGVENKGHLDAYQRAQDDGIELEYEWMATPDAHTRDSHRRLDGYCIQRGEIFPNGCEYPGDPFGPPAEVYNCRCRMVARLVGFPRDQSGRFMRLEDGETYDDWKTRYD